MSHESLLSFIANERAQIQVNREAARDQAMVRKLDLKITPVKSPLVNSFIIQNAPSPQITSFSPPPYVFTPSQINTAYGINQLPSSNQGQGTTIAIIDELIDPTITSDVAAFSAQFGLPQLDGLNGDGTLTTINDTAFGTPGTSAPGGTSIETALDVEWAHSIAPKANILLVFVPATVSLDNEFAEILHGDVLAATPSTATNLGLPPVVAVSTSYGYFTGTVIGAGGVHYNGLTNAQEQSLDSTYLATGAAQNLPLTFSSGDYGLPLFPAVDPNVIAVGGTSLSTVSAKGRYGYEVPWGGISGDGAGGGGVSTAFGLPSFQSGAGLNFSGRAIPDVSMVADPITGVPVYSQNDASVNGGDPWFAVGGTSLASPLFASVIALAQQNRESNDLPLLNSIGVNNVLYSTYDSSSYSTYFHDIVVGNNNDIDESRFGGINITGANATTGYDLASGIGSPIGNQLVSLLS
jgi:subtilase family serine protease